MTWFERHARPLSWRSGQRDPYLTWVVETMSQQTRIETVEARLPGFLARFPDLPSLAAAELDEVLAAWSGLGYYRRARSMHQAADQVVRQHGGRLPSTAEELARLPGVGGYTATAVAAQAFGRPGIAVDGNVRRVAARLLAEASPRERDLPTRLAALLLQDGEGLDPRLGEALVELGATVCKPRAPDCGRCPLRPVCRAAASGDPEAYPTPRRRPATKEMAWHAWLWRREAADGGSELALERRADDALWGGLYGPPWRAEPPQGGTRVGGFDHLLTHRRVKAQAWSVGAAPADAELRWARLPDLDGLGLAEIDRRALALLPSAATGPR